MVEASRAILFAGDLDRADRFARAAFALGPHSRAMLEAIDDVFLESGDAELGLEVCGRLVELTGPTEPSLTRLVNRLIAADCAQDALDLIDSRPNVEGALANARAEALVALDRTDEALSLLRHVVDHQTKAMRNSFTHDDWNLRKELLERAQMLHDGLVSERDGAEQVAVAAMRAGRIDTRSAVNFELLADSLMVASTYVPESVVVDVPAETLAARFDDGDAWAVARQGSARLRLGEVRHARRLFERSRELDGRCFAAYRGLAAVTTAERTRPFEGFRSLPSPQAPPELSRVVVDWTNLTEVERRIVIASAAPLRACFPALVAAGAQVRFLPIDVRTVDLPQFAPSRGERFEDDLRQLDALGGVASSREALAVSRLENLLGFADPHGLVFAHELAHLAYFCLDEDNPFAALHSEVLERPHLATLYQQGSADEFFTGAYEDFLRERWGLPKSRVDDDEGLWAALVAEIDALEKQT